MKIEHFEPGEYIEIDNPLTGKRMFGLVSDDGSGFLPYIDQNCPATPYPIFSELRPILAMSIQCYRLKIYEKDKADGELFSEFVSAIIDRLDPFDVLTFYRSVRWGVDSGSYNLTMSIDAGKIATAEAASLSNAVKRVADKLVDIK